jgi:nitrite reductase/ring-hydroxylating ferredoxin subunit
MPACRLHSRRYYVTTGSTMNVPDYGVTLYSVTVLDREILVAIG